jgi:hypothetical protein
VNGGRSTKQSFGSRGNALRHGLAARVLKQTDPGRLELLIQSLAQDSKDPRVRHAASEAAKARLYVERVLAVRAELRAGQVVGPDLLRMNVAEVKNDLKKLERYERDADRWWGRALDQLQLAFSARAHG